MSGFGKGVVKDAGRAGEQGGRSLGRSLMGALGKAAAIGGGIATVLGIRNLGKAALESAQGIQQTRAVLTGLLGSAESAADTMQRVRNVARDSPIEYSSYNSAAEAFAYLGVEGEQLENILGNVGAAITAAGGTGENLDRASGAMTNMVNQGKVLRQDLNVLSSAGVPIFDGLAQHFDVTVEELNRMISDGQVGIEDVMSVMENGTGDYFEMMINASEEASNTWSAQWAMAKDNIITAIGEGIDPMLTAITPALKSFAEWVGPALEAGMAKFGAAMQVGVEWVQDKLIPAVSTLWGWLQDNLLPVFENVAAWVGEHIVPALKDFAEGVGGSILGNIQTLWERLTELGDWFQSNDSEIRGVADTVGEVLGGAIRKAGDFIGWLIGLGAKLTGWLIDNKGVVLVAAAAYGTWKAVMLGINFGRFIADLAKSVIAWGRETAATVANTGAKIASKAETLALVAMYAGQWIKQQAMSIAGWVRETAVMVAHKAAQLASAAATKAVAIAQRALNLVMRANPIGLVVTALLALGAGLVAAYKKSETFRNIVDGAWSAIKTVVGAVWNFLRDKVFAPIVNWFKTLGQRATSMKDSIKGAWDKLASALGAAWNWIYRNVVQSFIAGFTNLQDKFKLRINQVRAIWNGIKAVFHAVYNWVKQRVIDAFTTAINNWRNNISRVVDRVKTIWNGLKNAFRSVYDWIKTNVVDRFKSTLDSLHDKVRTIRDRIGDAWRGIANKFRTPINWVINRVWNDGIAKAFNSAASALGISTRISDNAAIPAFAKGGYHKGGWALVGEQGPELVNFDRPGRVYTNEQSQALAAPGPVGDLADQAGSVLGSITGGVLGGAAASLVAAAKAILNPLKSLINSTVGQWGSVGSLAGGVAKSAIDSVLKWVDNKEESTGGKNFGTLGSAPGSGKWRRPSRGPVTSEFGMRWGRLHAGIDVAGGGPTYAAADGTVYRVGTGILSGRTGVGIGLAHGGNAFTYYGHNPYGGPRVRPGQQVKAGQHIGYQGATGNVTGTHLHFELHRGGWGRAVNPRQLGVFDEGGMLAPGAAAINLGNKPEPVLTPGQWDIMKSAVTTSPGLSADEQYQALYTGARDGVSSGFTGATRSARATARMGGY